MKSTFAALLLVVRSVTLDSQSALPAAELLPFRINRLVVTDLPELGTPRVTITGKTQYGEEIPLFITEDTSFAEALECFLYFDDSIQSVRIEVSSPISDPLSFEYATTLNPYQVSVFSNLGRMLAPLPGYRFASNGGQLRAGDILILEDSRSDQIRERNIGVFLDHGIHVITTRSLPEVKQVAGADESSLWRGTLLLLDSLDPRSLREILQSRRQAFSTVKKRYYDLIAACDFYGIPATANGTLIFQNARIADIAAAVELQNPPVRVTPFHKLLLLSFYLPALILIATSKRTPPRLLLPAVLLALFVTLSFLFPDPDKSLQLLLNPAHLSSERIELVRTAAGGAAGTRLQLLLPRRFEEQHFVPPDFDPTAWRLTYGLVRSNRKEIPLALFTAAAAVKFNQLPRIERKEGSYTLKYINPLRYWSLHEPD